MSKTEQMRGVVPERLYFSARHKIAEAAGVGVTAETNAVIAATLDYLRANDAPPAPAAEAPQVDELAQFIRQINGDNRMGAGALAEHICEWLSAAKTKEPT